MTRVVTTGIGMLSSLKLVRGLVPSQRLAKLAASHLVLLDFLIGWGRKIGGLAALAGLGWMSMTQLCSSQPVHALASPASDPELRHTIVLALLLVLSQGWDMPSSGLLASWTRLKSYFAGVARRSAMAKETPRGPIVPYALRRKFALVFNCFDLGIAVSNKAGALAFAIYLVYFLDKLCFEGTSLRAMYPNASDPFVSATADVCVYAVIIGWWATPMRRIVVLWRRLCRSFDGARSGPLPSTLGPQRG